MTRHILFALGQVVATKNAVELMTQKCITPFDLLHRHQHGDWGDLNEPDREANEQALIENLRILSSYDFDNEKIWIITEADRTLTTILLPSDY
ncbi:type I restriction endonuclease subunit M [Acinetobacter pittii]|uniref:type I restriction endonuclease subunit M n=1 Tax=Acinetobacter pittii TaxID=48296 RepID=UPI0021D2EBCB|nr:type I restriction endonuclease subunit M [Acinetobacter pittii]MCU4442136.1 type I restriction endonuclease subunit M [Acinetobacter pittii]